MQVAGILGQCKIKVLFIMSLMRSMALGSDVLGGVHWTSVNINIPIWTRIHTKLQLLISIWYDLTVFVIGFCWFLFASWCDISSCQMLPKKLMGCAGGNLKVLIFTFHVRFQGFVLQLLVGFFVWMSNQKMGKTPFAKSFPFVKFSKWHPKKMMLLLMEEILHQLICTISHYL